MTFDELLTEVYLLTSRSDLIDQTKAAIKAATLKAHQSDFYSKDIYERHVELSGDAAYVHSLDYISLISNFRAIKYLRKFDSSDSSDSSGASDGFGVAGALAPPPLPNTLTTGSERG